jgi:hypothetical protein
MNIREKCPNVFKALAKRYGARKAVRIIKSWNIWEGAGYVFHTVKLKDL